MKRLAKLTCGLVVLGGALVGLSGVAAADAPEIIYPDAQTCTSLYNTDPYAGPLTGALRSPAEQPETILICRLHAQAHL
jgi:hypothetical protein